jgi:membrane protease YdiL (CAAX protease family)
MRETMSTDHMATGRTDAPTADTKAALIMAAFILTEGAWVGVNLLPDPQRFLNILGFASGRLGTPQGWLVAMIVAGTFIFLSLRLPSVRANLVRPSFLKLLAILMAIAAGTLEEAIFRRMLMNYLQTEGFGVIAQIALSALAFGVSHGIWGLFGRSKQAALGATIATTVLGGGLAIAYVVSGRSVASAIAAHVLIDVFIEPGLILAALRGEMGSGSAAKPR